MDIAILRTDAADQRPGLHNIVEYRAALDGIRVIGYVSSDGTDLFRGDPLCA